MRTFCAWCNRESVDGKWQESKYPENELVSHGICEECKTKMVQDSWQMRAASWKKKILESMGEDQ